MPRGKNYVNNNRGVFLQAGSHKAMQMKLCEYGSACTRPDCIYRHEFGTNPRKNDDVCLPFLAGKCTFSESGCRKRHPEQVECDRLIAKYKRTRCRFGEECRTDGCLYLHPSEMKPVEPNYIEPHHIAFPPLSSPTSKSNSNPSSLPSNKVPINSAWKVAPTTNPMVTQHPTATPTPLQASSVEWHPSMPSNHYPDPSAIPYYDPGAHMFVDTAYASDAFVEGPNPYYNPGPHVVPPPNTPSPGAKSEHFNVNAKEFVPGTKSS